MSNDNFYLTLPSNTGLNASASNFRVALPRMIRLCGDWEVALVEVIYPYSWYNVTRTIPISIDAINGKEIRTVSWVALVSGHYTDIRQVIKALNNSIPDEHKKRLLFSYMETANRVTIDMEYNAVKTLHMPASLLYMLGYDLKTYKTTYPGTAPHPPDIRMGLSTLFIYCDLVEHCVVGDKLAPLLRAVATEGQFGDIVDRVFDHPHYMPVLKKEFDSVEIAIKTDQNEPLALQYGKTLVKLHFKRKSTMPIFV